MRGGLALALLSGLLLSTLPVAESRAATSPSPLFDAPAGVRAASPGVSSRATVRQRPVTSRLDLLVRPDGSPALGAGERIELNLFDDARFSMTVTEVTRHPGHGLTWSGTLDGVDLGSVVLALHDGALAGQVWMPGTTYRIGYTHDGTAVVEEIDQAAFPREAPSVVPPGLGVLAPEPEAADATPGSASSIDVAVLYTGAARAAAGGTAAMRAEVALAVAAANQAYANNDLVQRLRLVFAGESPLKEADFSNDLIAFLSALRANAAGGWIRDVTRADALSLIVEYGAGATFCGRGYQLTANSTAFAPNAFSVVERSCASANLTFPHELGHNMGADHDVFVIGTDAVFSPYSHGWVDLVGKFRTIMAYPDQCTAASTTCPKVTFFSTPGKTVTGRVVGNATTANNARVLGETANTVANFRTALTSPLAITAAVNQPTFTVGQTLVTSVSLNHPGGVAGAADFYVGLLLPNGSAVFFTSVTITPTSGYALGTITNFASYRPIATGIPLGAPFTANIPSFFAYARGAGDPTGGLAFFLLAVKSGALGDGVLATDELLSASLAPFTFPAGSPADAACPAAGCAP
jgi:peptidyl-Asp metalloendopeptidase